MQQISRRTPMPRCDFNKVALQHGCSPRNLLHILRTPFPKKISGRLLLYTSKKCFLNSCKTYVYVTMLLWSSLVFESQRIVQFLHQKNCPYMRHGGAEAKSNILSILSTINCRILYIVRKMLQKLKLCLLYVSYSCYVKFYFHYIFHIYVICFVIYLLNIYMCYICFLCLLYISISN